MGKIFPLSPYSLLFSIFYFLFSIYTKNASCMRINRLSDKLYAVSELDCMNALEMRLRLGGFAINILYSTRIFVLL